MAIRPIPLVLTLGALAPAPVLGGPARGAPPTAAAWSASRIVHRFDFDERAAGNLEEVPKFWEALRPAGFPGFAQGTFDFERGRLKPPSFHLACEGRNVAYQYTGPETRVRPDSEYRIEGFIRADHLRYARACLSAYYLDRFGEPIPKTLVRSAYVPGAGGADGWVRVGLHLAAAPKEAYSIGLAAWVLQKPVWSTEPLPKRHIPHRDVRAGAWFDDITIYALPHVQLNTASPGSVLSPTGPQEIHVTLADASGGDVQGRLSITAAGGELIETHDVPVGRSAIPEPVPISVAHLPPGLYHARLDVFAGHPLRGAEQRQRDPSRVPAGRPAAIRAPGSSPVTQSKIERNKTSAAGPSRIVSRSLTFARLGPVLRKPFTKARSFGLVVDPQARSEPDTELALLSQQGVGTVELPVWTGRYDDATTASKRRLADRLRRELLKRGFVLGGVLAGPPGAIVQTDGAYVRPLVDLLAGEPGVWRDYLAAEVAPYASTFRWWQVGADRAPPSAAVKQLNLAVAQLREAMSPFIAMPRLSIPVSAAQEPAGPKLPVERVTLSVERGLGVSAFAEQIKRLKSSGYEQVSVYIEPLEADRYRRLPRIAHWAQRVIAAKHHGADTVLVPQTWHLRDAAQGRVTEPTERYLLLRTMAHVLADTTPGPRVPLAGHVQAFAFYDGSSAVLALWDPAAPKGGSRYPIQLGRARRQISLWGVATPLKRDETGRQIVELTAVPVLVPGVERWLIEFRTSIVMKPVHVESGRELVEHTIEMAYKGDRSVFGTMELGVAESWEVTPRAVSFGLNPSRAGPPETHRVEVRYPHNEPAGSKQIQARIRLTVSDYYLEVPLPIDIGVADLDVWGSAVVDGSELVLRHIVTNRSSQVLSFRGSARVPGRPRQYRPMSNLGTGTTQAVEYRFPGGPQLIGRSARLVLREMNDGPRIHDLELIVP